MMRAEKSAPCTGPWADACSRASSHTWRSVNDAISHFCNVCNRDDAIDRLHFRCGDFIRGGAHHYLSFGGPVFRVEFNVVAWMFSALLLSRFTFPFGFVSASIESNYYLRFYASSGWCPFFHSSVSLKFSLNYKKLLFSARSLALPLLPLCHCFCRPSAPNKTAFDRADLWQSCAHLSLHPTTRHVFFVSSSGLHCTNQDQYFRSR